MKQVVLNLGQPQYTTLDKPSQPVKKLPSTVKSQPAAAKPSVTFEQAEHEHDVFKPQPTEFVSAFTSRASRPIELMKFVKISQSYCQSLTAPFFLRCSVEGKMMGKTTQRRKRKDLLHDVM